METPKLATPRKPDWLKVKAPGGERYLQIKQQLRELKLHTVCEEARCPNMGECWSGGTATIMLLGDVCTRGCRFCAVKTGKLDGVVDTEEPRKVGGLIAVSGLHYVVLTSVNRDDLPDGGAKHFADTIREIKAREPKILCEALVPDFQGKLKSVEELVLGGVDVYAHNIETVRSQTPRVRDRRATYDQSLATLKHAKEFAGRALAEGLISHPVYTKSSIQVGHGETDEEIEQTMRDLRANLVNVVTFGQYLQPTRKHLKVVEFVSPLKFRMWEEKARAMGFLYVASGPLVRSSYRAGEFFMNNMIREERGTHGI
ncbi:MAG: lipoyl synthase [Deltaproteobacteria bacterium]|nr:lipoyl synthase [Deltaproteobacteria bacterium]